MNNLNERVLELESELRDFERFEYEDLLELEEYFGSDDFEQDLKKFMEGDDRWN